MTVPAEKPGCPPAPPGPSAPLDSIRLPPAKRRGHPDYSADGDFALSRRSRPRNNLNVPSPPMTSTRCTTPPAILIVAVLLALARTATGQEGVAAVPAPLPPGLSLTIQQLDASGNPA